MTSIAQEAQKCHQEYGWNVIPVHGKEPACQWKRFQGDHQTRDQVRELFKRQSSGLAVITGPVSNGLAIRDFDDPDAYDRWATRCPALANELPTVQTSRGMHVYFRSHSSTFAEFDDGELRGDGKHYTIVPPSRHPDGGAYRWEIPPIGGTAGNLCLLDAAETGLDQSWSGNPSKSQQHIAAILALGTYGTHNQGEEKIGVFQSGVRLEHSEGDFENLIESAIQTTIPRREGQRNACVFQFARRLKSIPQLADKDAESLKSLVQRWYERALPFIRTTEFAVSFQDFARGWTVAYPSDQTAVDIAAQKALRFVPETALRYLDPRISFLVGVCYDLQEYNGEGPFFLGCRDAARVMGMGGPNGHRDAWRMLQQLEKDGILQVVERGSPGVVNGGKATSYRYVAGD